MVGSLWPVILLKIIFIIVPLIFYYRNKYTTLFTYFMFVHCLILGVFILGMACYNNILGILNPKLVEYASQLPSEVKIRGYITFVSFIYIIPFTISLISFKFYEWTLKDVTIEK